MAAGTYRRGTEVLLMFFASLFRRWYRSSAHLLCVCLMVPSLSLSTKKFLKKGLLHRAHQYAGAAVLRAGLGELVGPPLLASS